MPTLVKLQKGTEVAGSDKEGFVSFEDGRPCHFEFFEDDNTFTVTGGLRDGTRVSLIVELSPEFLSQVVSIAAKRLNKLRSVLDGLK